MRSKLLLLLLVTGCCLFMVSCSTFGARENFFGLGGELQTPEAAAISITEIPSLTPSPVFLLSPSPTYTNTPLPTYTLMPIPTHTYTPSPIPTYQILRGKVLLEHVNCRYGPGWMYLYKYGLVGGSNLEVIGRTDRGHWILIQAIGGNNPCWVKADLMELTGDVMSLPPLEVDVVQAWSPYYAPLTKVSAQRNGDIVTVSWAPLARRAGDEVVEFLYVVEAWVCQDGDFGFVPYGSNFNYIDVLDEAGCEQESHGQVLAAEKHGYTWPVAVIWP